MSPSWCRNSGGSLAKVKSGSPAYLRWLQQLAFHTRHLPMKAFPRVHLLPRLIVGLDLAGELPWGVRDEIEAQRALGDVPAPNGNVSR